MPIRAEITDGVPQLHVDGEMTIYTATELKEQLLSYVTRPGQVELNLAQVSDLDSAGLQLLILAKREALRVGASMHMTGHSRAVLDALDLCDLAAFFGDPLVLSD
jgi:anti-anti-sigma factor